MAPAIIKPLPGRCATINTSWLLHEPLLTRPPIAPMIPAIVPSDSPQRRRQIKRYIMALVSFASAAGPALATQCPMLQAQIDKAVGTRADASAATTKQLAAEAWSLHHPFNHSESEAKYDENPKAAGV